ncbi:RNA polymerase sigma factor SigI [Nocardia sp. CA-084685]|uniref:RNA polymerase sigma factor SigI n=1 Tax=Nocardia sp. CA-084685 TaxID=3239970 RepID=UPI003D999149
MTSHDRGTAFDQAWQGNRAYLVDLAFRMLGDIGDAEDVVQEAFTRLDHIDIGVLADVRGWLTVVTSRICLDMLRSARVRHEWPGDPMRMEALDSPYRAAAADPADRITLDEDVQFALLVVLQRLRPAERVAFVLHDVFAMPFDTIAETLGQPIGTCRQLARRARLKLAGTRPDTAALAPEYRTVTAKFIDACATGDLTTLLTVLHPEAWGIATFLGGSIGPQISHGRTQVGQNLLTYYTNRAVLVSHSVLDQPAILAFIDHRFFALLVLTVEDGLVRKIEATVNPTRR